MNFLNLFFKHNKPSIELSKYPNSFIKVSEQDYNTFWSKNINKELLIKQIANNKTRQCSLLAANYFDQFYNNKVSARTYILSMFLRIAVTKQDYDKCSFLMHYGADPRVECFQTGTSALTKSFRLPEFVTQFLLLVNKHDLPKISLDSCLIQDDLVLLEEYENEQELKNLVSNLYC